MALDWKGSWRSWWQRGNRRVAGCCCGSRRGSRRRGSRQGGGRGGGGRFGGGRCGGRVGVGRCSGHAGVQGLEKLQVALGSDPCDDPVVQGSVPEGRRLQ